MASGAESARITKGMTIEAIIRRFPYTAHVFRQFGVPCGECGLAPIDDLETGARIHRIDLTALLAALNTATLSRSHPPAP